MMARAILSWLVFLAMETGCQIALKLGGEQLHGPINLPMLLRAWTSPWVLLGYALYFGAFLAWMTIIRFAEISRAYPMSALLYVFSLIAAVVLFHEHVTLIRLAGLAAIVTGVTILASEEQ